MHIVTFNPNQPKDSSITLEIILIMVITLLHHKVLLIIQLDHLDATFHQDLRLPDHNGHPFDTPNPFASNRPHTHQSLQQQVENGSPHTPLQHTSGSAGQFGILTTGSVQHTSIGRLQQEDDMFGTGTGTGTANNASDQTSHGHLPTRIVPDPPNLTEWRQKLFDVNEMITLSKDEFVIVLSSGENTDFIQIRDLFPSCRQRLLPPIYAKLQAQAVRLSLLGLPAEGTSARNTEV